MDIGKHSNPANASDGSELASYIMAVLQLRDLTSVYQNSAQAEEFKIKRNHYSDTSSVTSVYESHPEPDQESGRKDE